ncbi:uncharacterized protein [Amphiura filiformis]|uniref:uncharacterized protein n=1 Tax=Amphiura filiformis TaxID=82378 RepID=UPI003B20F551
MGHETKALKDFEVKDSEECEKSPDKHHRDRHHDRYTDVPRESRRRPRDHPENSRNLGDTSTLSSTLATSITNLVNLQGNWLNNFVGSVRNLIFEEEAVRDGVICAITESRDGRPADKHVTNAHHMQPPPTHRRAKSRERERFATIDPPYIDEVGGPRDRNHNLPNGGFERVERGRSSHRGPPSRESSLDKDYRYGMDHYGHEDSSRLGVYDNRERRGSREFRLDPNRRPSFLSQGDVRQDNSDGWPQDNKDASKSYTSSSGHLDAPMYRGERRKSHEFDRVPLAGTVLKGPAPRPRQRTQREAMERTGSSGLR